MPSLADLYLARGNQAADTVLRDAAIRSQQQQASGANWGRSLAAIGQTVAAIPGQLQEAKQIEQQGQITQMRLDDANAQRASAAQAAIDQQKVNEIISGFQTSESGARTIPRAKLQAAFAQANIPLDLQGQTFKALDAVDASLESFAKARREHGTQFAKTVLDSGVDLNDPNALTMAVALAKGNGLIDDEFINQFSGALQSGIPAKSILQQLAGPQEKKSPVALGKDSRLVDPNTGKVLIDAQPSEPKLYPVTVDDGKGRPVEKLVTAEELQKGVPAYRAPQSASSEAHFWVMRDGQPIRVSESQYRVGDQPPETADMRNKAAGRELVGKSISAIKTLGDRIITKIGPSQRADAIKRGAEAVFGNDPEFRTYQDARMALAGNLAVAQQGSRPSDADIKAIWLPLVPDAYRDTAESAAMKWGLINTMSNTDTGPAAQQSIGRFTVEVE
jgi:hypothetical protein